MLGTHNSLTYAEPTYWLMRPFNFLARCQSKSIEEQLSAGVRFFDIRIKENSIKAWHGLMSYDKSPFMALVTLERYAKLHPFEVVCFRIVLEYGNEPSNSSVKKDTFKTIVEDILTDCEMLKFCGAYCKWDWECVVEPTYKVSYKSCYSSFYGWKGFPYIPVLWSLMHKKMMRENKRFIDDNNVVVLADFV